MAFVPPFQSAPGIGFGPGGISYHHGIGSAKSQTQVVEAVNPSASGFDLRARIREVLTATLTTRTAAFVSGGVDPAWRADKPQAAEAYDDRYTFVYDVSLRGSSSGGFEIQ